MSEKIANDAERTGDSRTLFRAMLGETQAVFGELSRRCSFIRFTPVLTSREISDERSTSDRPTERQEPIDARIRQLAESGDKEEE